MKNISNKTLSTAIIAEFEFDATKGQLSLINKISSFINSKKKQEIFVLRGYAGTGKTTSISAIINALYKLGIKTCQLAPTGKASKVMTFFSNKTASTIHKKIYQQQLNKDGNIKLDLAVNLHTNTFFFVDEASMIHTYSGISNGTNYRDLLEDLIEYIYSGKNCKLILIGDTMQLPPVGMSESPALDEKYLSNEFFNFKIITHSLNEVVRQQSKSTILENATKLRKIKKGYPKFTLNKIDFINLNSNSLKDELDCSISNLGPDETIVLCRSNKRANLYNESIRRRILFMEDEINSGDILMVVKNNYFWIDEKTEAGFIANGDTILIEKIGKKENLYGFNFVSARVKLIDYPKMDSIELNLLINTIHSQTPSMSREEMKNLFFEIEKDYLYEKNRKKRFKKVLQNKYFNALQVKFSYAITCHKSQGGQWENVFIDHSFFIQEKLNLEYYRWLYTAITRARKKVYLINFSSNFFDEK